MIVCTCERCAWACDGLTKGFPKTAKEVMKFFLVVFGDREGVRVWDMLGVLMQEPVDRRLGYTVQGIPTSWYRRVMRSGGGEVVGQHFPERPSPLSNQTQHSMISVLVGTALVLLSGLMTIQTM